MIRPIARTTARSVACLLVGGLLTTLLASCVSESSTQAGRPRPIRQCFVPSIVTSFRSTDDRIIHIRAGANEVFQLEAIPFCRDLNWSTRMSIRPRFGSNLCVGDSATIVTRGLARPRRCTVWVRARLTPEQVAALPARNRP